MYSENSSGYRFDFNILWKMSSECYLMDNEFVKELYENLFNLNISPESDEGSCRIF